jgi:GT2 family glycosyltransferase
LSDDPAAIRSSVEDAARRRSEARAAQDWQTADRLRAEIEAAGWRVIDRGTSYRLERATPPDVEVGGEIRYGRSDAVPSRLGDPASGFATVVFVASRDGGENRRSLAGMMAGSPSGVDVVVVADGIRNEAIDGLAVESVEIVRTSAPLGQGAALNIGIRRASAPIVIVLDPSITPTGDVVSPLVDALADPTVAIAGPFGLASPDLRQFNEVVAPTGPRAAVVPRAVVAIQGYLMAFRRGDAAAFGPIDERFRFYRNLDIWWSLVLRDEGEGRQPRRAVVVPGLPIERAEPAAWRDTAAAERDRLSKRNFYRVLDRFRTRLDLAIPPEG